MKELPTPSGPVLLALPVMLYTVALLFFDLRSFGAPALLGLLLTALPLLGLPTGRAGAFLWAAPGAALLGGFLLALPSGFALNSAGMGLLGGVALGSPLAIYAALLLWGEQAFAHLLLLLAGLVDVLALNAAAARIGTGTPAALAQAYGQVQSDQLAGLIALLGGASAANLPLQPIPGLVVALLALLALAGVFLAFVRPMAAAAGEGIPARQTILGPALLGVVAASGFELVAIRSPELALTGLAAGVSVISLIVVWVGRSVPLARPAEPPSPAAELTAGKNLRPPPSRKSTPAAQPTR